MAKTKSDLVQSIVARAKMTHAHGKRVVDGVFACLVEALMRGEGIDLRGFGTFTLRSYREYDGRNPRTGEPIHVKTKRLPVFKVGKELRQRVLAGGVAAAERK
jgi:integration host factor subunit beta